MKSDSLSIRRVSRIMACLCPVALSFDNAGESIPGRQPAVEAPKIGLRSFVENGTPQIFSLRAANPFFGRYCPLLSGHFWHSSPLFPVMCALLVHSRS